MLYVDNQNITDPHVNLALEEYVLRNIITEKPILLFYINEPAVIIGRNQNTLAEIDPHYIRDNSIHLVRRLSGGGAVYHDLGNLNFSFITNGREGLHDFARFTEPVVNVLRRLGVNAELRGKSDIFADGKKISGNAQYATANRMFSHGTLLYDTTLLHMLRALNPRQMKIESKAVQSVRNFVANVRELLTQDYTIYELRQALLEGIFGTAEVPTYALEQDDWIQIYQLANGRYRTWEWNYGRSPQFNVQKSKESLVGKFDVRIDVADGHIQSLKLYGNFAGLEDVAGLESLLVGVRYDPDALAEALKNVDITPYVGDLPKWEFLTLLY